MNKRKEQLFADLTAASRDRKNQKLATAIRDNGNILDLRDGCGRTLLHYCAEHDHTASADQILARRPDLLTAQDDDGFNVLHLSAISGNLLLLKFLLQEAQRLLKGDKFLQFVNCFDRENHTALHWATVSSEFSCLKALNAAGADPSLSDVHGAHPIHYAAQNTQQRARAKDSLLILKEIVAFAPSEKDCRDRDGRTPLIWAASSGNLEAILILLSAKADVSQQDKDGLTALHCAASRGFQDCMQTLIDFGGTVVDQMDSNGCTALFYAVTLGHADCVQYLLSRGAVADHQDRKGRSAGHCGAARGQLETLKILHQRGGNLWLRNIRGDMPIHDAVRSGRKELVIWLLEHRSSVADFSNTMGKTPLHVACLENNVEMCKVLLDFAADVNSVMKAKGVVMTPLDLCLQNGFRSCAKFLLMHGALPSSKLTEYRRFTRSRDRHDSGPDMSGSSASLVREFGIGNELANLHSHSESSHSITEIRLPPRLKAQSTVSQKVRVYSDTPTSPDSTVSPSDMESRSHTMITNVYVSAFPAPRKRLLKKIRRKKNKSRSPCAQNLQLPSHEVNIWSAEETANMEGNGSFLEQEEDGETVRGIVREDRNDGTSSSQESGVAAGETESQKGLTLRPLTEVISNHSPTSGYSGDGSDHGAVSPVPEQGLCEEAEPVIHVPDETADRIETEEQKSIAPSSPNLQSVTELHEDVDDIIVAEVPPLTERETCDPITDPKCDTDYVSHEVDGALQAGDCEQPEIPTADALEVNESVEADVCESATDGNSETAKDSVEKNESEIAAEVPATRRKRDVDHEDSSALFPTHIPMLPQSVVADSLPKETELQGGEANNEQNTETHTLPSRSNANESDEHSVASEVVSKASEITHFEQEDRQPLTPADRLSSPEFGTPDAPVLSLIREETERTDHAEDRVVVPDMETKGLSDTGLEMGAHVTGNDSDANNKTLITATGMRKHSITFSKQSDSKNQNRRAEWKRGPAVVSTPKIKTAADKEDEEPGAEASTPDTLNEMTSLDTDDSLRESVSAGETDLPGKEDVVFNMRSGERIRATTTFELNATAGVGSKLRSSDIGHRSKRESRSKCAHKLHRKQSAAHVTPLDLAHVRSKVDTRTPDCFTKRPSPSFGKEGGPNFRKLTSQLAKSSRKYAAERKLFEELHDLKRCQLQANRAHETVLVKKLVDRYNSDIYYPGLDSYTGMYDFSSFESFLYEQLRRLSLSSPDRVRSSSVDNMQRLEIEHKLTNKSLSAEVLMSRPRFQTRFLDLEDGHSGRKPCICGLESGPQVTKSHRRTMSDVVKTETSLNYGIITRATKPQSFFATVTEPLTAATEISASPLTTVAKERGKLPVLSHASVRTAVPSVARSGDSIDSPNSQFTSRSSGAKATVSTVGHKHRRKSPEKIHVDNEAISKRWHAIKVEERRKSRSASSTPAEVMLMYEVSGRGGNSAHEAHTHRLSRPLPELRTGHRC